MQYMQYMYSKIKLKFSFFFGLLQLTTALVLIHSGISETSARLCRGHGLLHCAFIHDVGHGVFIHSYFQLENDQIYGIFYVCVLFHFCGHHTRIWIWFLGLPNLEQVHTTVAVPYNIPKQYIVFCCYNCLDLQYEKLYFVTNIVLTYCEKKLL